LERIDIVTTLILLINEHGVYLSIYLGLLKFFSLMLYSFFFFFWQN
jgi:hypothetical protein